MNSLAFCFGVHNHQPIGNFDSVLLEATERAYRPFLELVRRRPDVRLSVHCTGSLLAWLRAQACRTFDLLGEAVSAGQVELLTGGFYEPILAVLPDPDKRGQIQRLTEFLAREFGVRARGMWLAERVWEPHLPKALREAGVEFVLLDDSHFALAGLDPETLGGYYVTEEQGQTLAVFPISQRLRYLIPFAEVDKTLEYLEARRGAVPAVTVVDDGEKFGAWPGTHELCWTEEQWVDRCFEALNENSDWLSTVTPSQWMADHAAVGRVYIPTSSYVEMTEWALPTSEQPVFREVVDSASALDAPEMRFLRGALWRNFQARYREINDLHKQMQRVSGAVEAMPAGPDRDRAVDHLYRGQSNDCYWHGWFGGIYIVHMRMATLAQLIAAEDLALGEDGVLHGAADYDLDGIEEVALGTVGQTVIVDVAEGAGIGSWDLRTTNVALASVLRRRPEPYHQRIIEAARHPVADHTDAGVTDLSELIVYDDHERRSGLVRVLDQVGDQLGELDRAPWTLDQAEPSWLAASCSADGLNVRKEIGVAGGRRDGELWLTVTVENLAVDQFDGSLELEWNLNLLGGGANPAAFYRSGEREWRHDSSASVAAGAELTFGNSFEGVEISVSAVPPASASWNAVETVSNSESGFERVYQGSCLIQRWPLWLAHRQSTRCTTRLRVRQSRND
jgi:4-alpha-glucanotransferase